MYTELLVRVEGYHRERERVVVGLEAALDLVELAEEEQDQQAQTPQYTPQDGRSTKEDEGLLAGHEEGSDELNEIHHGGLSLGEEMENGQNDGTSRGAPAPEGLQAPGQTIPKKL